MLRDNAHTTEVAIMYKEVLKDNRIHFEPYIAEIGDLSHKYGHKEDFLMNFVKPSFDKNSIEKQLDLHNPYFKVAE